MTRSLSETSAQRTKRRALLSELREIDHQAALNARLARRNTLLAFAASARMMRADLLSGRPVSRRDFQTGARAISLPAPPPRSYSRAGVSYVHTQQTRDGLRHTPFHLRVTQCNHGGRAVAHQQYIERETAVVYQVGTISDDPDERRDFWRQIAARASLRRGTISLPREADPALRDALRPLLEAMEHDGKIPPRVARAWLRKPRNPLVIRQLDQDQYEYAAKTIGHVYRTAVDDRWSPPRAAGKPPGLPPGFGAYSPRSPQIQRRMVLELPHEVLPEARERILRRFCSRVFGARAIPYHAVIHAPAEGNDSRNWHAHIVSTHHDIRRDPATGQWDFLAHDRLPPVHAFGQIITGNARGADGRPLPSRKDKADKMKGLFREIREDFSALANGELMLAAATRRYDPRSYRNQGIDVVPAIHVGPGGTGIGKRGAVAGRTPHQAAWMNVANAIAVALPEEDPDDIRDTLELEQIVRTVPDPNALFQPPAGPLFLALQRHRSTADLLDETVEALDRLPDPPHRLAVAEPDVVPQRLPSPIQATGRPSATALGDAPGRTAIAEPDIRPQPIEIRGAVQRSPMPTAHALQEPPHHLAVAEPDVRPQRLPSPIQATGRPSPAALGDAPGRTVIAEPDIRPQPIENPVAVQRSPMPTAHSLPDPPRRLTVAEPDVRPQRLPSPIQATGRPSPAALGDAPRRTVIAEPDIRPQPIEIRGAVQRSPAPTPHALQEPPRRIAVAEPDVRPQQFNRDEIPEIPVRDPAVPETAPAIPDEQALAQRLRLHLRDFGVAVLHALRSRSSLHLPPLPGLGPEATHHIALTLASHQALHISDTPLQSWHTLIDDRPRYIRVLPLHLARTAWPIHQLEQHLASPATPDTEAATRALLRTHRTALVTAALLAPHLEDHERPPTVPGLAPDASAAAFRLLRKSLRHRVPRDPSGIYAALMDANKPAELHLDDIARLIHQHGLDGSLDLLAPPKPTRPRRGTSVQR